MPTLNDIINLGFSKHQEGRLIEAEGAYQEALKFEGENPDVCNLMGVPTYEANWLMFVIIAVLLIPIIIAPIVYKLTDRENA